MWREGRKRRGGRREGGKERRVEENVRQDTSSTSSSYMVFHEKETSLVVRMVYLLGWSGRPRTEVHVFQV